MNTSQQSGWRFRSFVVIGYAALIFLLLGLGSWGVMARISGAVIASGTVEVLGNRQVVQHPNGGVITDIFARDGDAVAAGDVLVRLEGDALGAELEIVEGQYFELVARKSRLAAQRDQLLRVTFGQELIARAASQPGLGELMAAQDVQFQSRQSALREEIDQLDERTGQIANQIIGLEAQLAATEEQAAFIGQDLATQEKLLAQGLTQMTRVLDVRRELSRLKGSRGQIMSGIAENRGQLAEVEIEKLKLVTRQREEAIDELREIEFREIELRARRRTLGVDIARLDVRAPVDGIVYSSSADTLRAVIRAAEPILYIVPQDVDLIVRTRIDAASIDQVRAGQAAMLRFPAFEARTTPDFPGRVAEVSADIYTDEVTGQAFYRADLRLDADSLALLKDLRLLPGMPAEAFIRTDERTPLSYFVKPLADYFAKAFRER